MPLSAAFHFFSPFHSKKKYHRTIFSIHFFSFLLYPSLFSLPTSISILPSRRVSFIGYIHHLTYYTIKYNKKSGDLIAKSPSPINTLYITI